MIPKIAATLSLVSALSLVSQEPAQSAPFTSLSTLKFGAEQTHTVQVRWRHGWHVGQAGASPSFYGGTYLGNTYGGFTAPPAACVFPCWRPYVWYRPHYFRWWY